MTTMIRCPGGRTTDFYRSVLAEALGVFLSDNSGRFNDGMPEARPAYFAKGLIASVSASGV